MWRRRDRQTVPNMTVLRVCRCGQLIPPPQGAAPPQQAKRQGLCRSTLEEDPPSRPPTRRLGLPSLRSTRHPRRSPTPGHRPPRLRRKPLRPNAPPRGVRLMLGPSRRSPSPRYPGGHPNHRKTRSASNPEPSNPRGKLLSPLRSLPSVATISGSGRTGRRAARNASASCRPTRSARIRSSVPASTRGAGSVTPRRIGSGGLVGAPRRATAHWSPSQKRRLTPIGGVPPGTSGMSLFADSADDPRAGRG